MFFGGLSTPIFWQLEILRIFGVRSEIGVGVDFHWPGPEDPSASDFSGSGQWKFTKRRLSDLGDGKFEMKKLSDFGETIRVCTRARARNNRETPTFGGLRCIRGFRPAFWPIGEGGQMGPRPHQGDEEGQATNKSVHFL